MVGYLLVGCVISYSMLYNDTKLSKPHWLLALILLAMAWPGVAVIYIIALFKPGWLRR